MKAEIKIKIEPFTVPVLVYETGYHPVAASAVPVLRVPCSWSDPEIKPREFRLSEIPVDVLIDMCDEFRNEVFKRAGKRQPVPEQES